jgi:hypothetical protein
MAPTPSVGASHGVAYGNANNCGVKGYGYHDHGKPCPNRPFPGHGKGVTDILSGNSPSQTTAGKAAKTSSGDDDATTLSVSATTGSHEVAGSTSAAQRGKGHGHGKVHG